MAVSAVVAYLAVLLEVSPQEYISLASRRAWATRAVASKDISSPVKARSKPDVSPPIVRYARAGDCNVLSFLAFLGQMSSPAQCPRAPHA